MRDLRLGVWLLMVTAVCGCGGNRKVSGVKHGQEPDSGSVPGVDGGGTDSGPGVQVPDGGGPGNHDGSTTADGASTPTEPDPGEYKIGMPMGGGGGAWEATPQTGGDVPVIVYPNDQTRFPRNIYRTLFQWRPGSATQFRLTFTGPRTKVEAFTDGVHPQCADKANAACWEADENAWFLIASGNAGSAVTVTIDGLDTSTSPATVRRSAPITIAFSRQNVEGAIFYWSTTAAGIRRASVASGQPDDYLTGKPATRYTDPTDSIKCVACHVVSRDGRYMLAPVQAASGSGLWVLEVTRTAPPQPLIKNVPDTQGHGFATISPDNSRVVAAWGGKMWMLDRESGSSLAPIALGSTLATQPDWSPDNSQLVFATGKGDSPGGAGLATVAWSNGVWGPPTVLVPAPANGSNLFPMHSHDGRWIAYSRGKGGHGDLTAQLFLVDAKGGTPVELLAANRAVSNQATLGQHQNSQPTWAPSGDLYWVAFNSMREYGVVLPGGRQQIWVAAIDPAKLGTNMDPSYPAFRLQFQGLEEDNHRAYWTLDVRDTPPPPPPPPPAPDGGVCIASNATCDPVADRCCDDRARCDSYDEGMTYRCYPPIIID
jgi:hypothetical protein